MTKMAEVAEHINAMKTKYDTAVHVQEIQNLIRGNEVPTLVSIVIVAMCICIYVHLSYSEWA